MYAACVSYLCAAIFIDAPEDVPLALIRAERAKDAGANLIEWRADALAEASDGAACIAVLLEKSPLPAIVTIRSEAEGGTWAGDEADRVALLEAIGIGSAPPRYFDVELGSWQRSANLRQKVSLVINHAAQQRDISAGLILSSHDFAGRPRDLLSRYAAMVEADECAVAKVVWGARTLRDNLEAFELLAGRAKPTIVLLMGEFGLMSRVLAPKFGGFLTFAAVDEHSGTAPGQPTIDDLKNLYRFDSINRETKVYGIVGWPVTHSKGPLWHNAAFGTIGFNGVYLPMPIHPEWEQFKATMLALIEDPRLDFAGCSVTLPHKEHLLRLVDEVGGHVDPLVRQIGAANTLLVSEARELSCFNTDAPAAVEALGACSERRVGILGAGGVARAVAAGLVNAGASVLVVNRSPERAEALAASIDGVNVGEQSDLEACDTIVNCTSVGMEGGPAPDASPLAASVSLNSTHTVFDTVYTPEETPLIRDARDAGATVVLGSVLFSLQAALQFEHWTGERMPS